MRLTKNFMLITNYKTVKTYEVLNKKEKQGQNKKRMFLMLKTIVSNVESPLIINVDKKVFSCIGNPALKPRDLFFV